MLLKECEGCKYLLKAIGIGAGVRCTHPQNNPNKDKVVSISYVGDCKYYTSRTDEDEK